jgi:SAM-dependent methyltransferase
MDQTPIHDSFNEHLLALIPRFQPRIVEVGCSSGALARAYLKDNPASEYIGIEIEPSYAQRARTWCTAVHVADIERMGSDEFSSFVSASCWIFGDVIEHLYDPWSVLRRVRDVLPTGGCVVACIPNAQHWSVQLRLNRGAFHYEDAGLLDRTHIRWFTKATIADLFNCCGLQIVEGGARVLHEPERDAALVGIRALAAATGFDADQAVADAIPFQYVLRAVRL